MEVDPVLKKEYSKQNLVRILSSGNSKIVYKLLIEVIVFYMGLIVIYV